MMNTNFGRSNAGPSAPVADIDWQFYGLSGNGFRLTPDADIHFAHSGFLDASAAVNRALARGEGFVVLTGPPGSGKTTLAEKLLARWETVGRICARVTSTQVDAADLLRLVAFAFGIKVKQSDGKARLLNALERHLVRCARKAGPAVLLVDEAQNLAPQALEELRLLTNLMADNRPLLQILLFGQSEFWQRLSDPENEQLCERIICSYQMRPLDAELTRDYIAYRLNCVGWAGQPRISGEALRLVHAYTNGIPRRINRLMTQLLSLGIAERARTLDVGEVQRVVDQLANDNLQSPAVSLADPMELSTATPMPSLKPLDSMVALEFAKANRAQGRGSSPAPTRARNPDHRRKSGSSGSRSRSRSRGGKGLRRFAVFEHIYTATDGLLADMFRFGAKGAAKPEEWLRRLSAPLQGWVQRVRATEWSARMALSMVSVVVALGIVTVGIAGLGDKAAKGPTSAPRVVDTPLPAAETALQGSAGEPQIQHPVASARLEMPSEISVEISSEMPNSEPVVSAPSVVESNRDDQVSPPVAEPSQPQSESSLPIDEMDLVRTDLAATDPVAFVTLGDVEGPVAVPVLYNDDLEQHAVASLEEDLLNRLMGPERADLLAASILDRLPPTAAGPAPEQEDILNAPLALSLERGADALVPAELGEATEATADIDPGAEKAAKIADLLKKADLAMTQQRYTLPPTNNANAYYHAVLAEEPDNAHALAGLSEISQKYWQMARRLLDKNDLDKAERITKRGLRADRNNKRLLALAEEVELSRHAAIAAAEAPPPEPLITQIEAPAAPEEADPEQLSSSATEDSSQNFFVH